MHQICSSLDVGEHLIDQIFPSAQKVNLAYLTKSLEIFQTNEGEIGQLWKLLVEKVTPADKKMT